jgi:hypothetical protein
MTENDRPLPTPPRSRFGQEAPEAAGAPSGMISDRMALAAAEGRLEEFLQHEIPEGDHARNLAMMMMGMSGMMPMEPPAGGAAAGAVPPPAPAAAAAPTEAAPEVPPEVLAAIAAGDVNNLMAVLRAEHAKRSGAVGAPADLPPAHVPPPAAGPPAADGRAGIDVALIDELVRIGADNDVTLDWLMLRAVKLYVAEYRTTGRL